MKKAYRYLWFLSLIVVVVLSACGKNGNETSNTSNKTGKSDAKGGTLTVGIAEPPEGNFQSIFTGSTGDSNVIDFFNDSLIDVGDDLKIKPKILSWEKDKNDDLKYTFKVKKGIQWQDGNPFTINDWVFTLETLADPDYDGPRYSGVAVIQGAEEKRNGQADRISGIKKIDDYTAEITFKEHKANNLLELWTSAPISEKVFKDIPVKDMAKSDAVRKNPIGIGPYKVKRIVDGESVELVKNKDYWRGEPNIDNINLRVVEQTSMTQALENGDIDMATITAPIAKEIKDSGSENLQLLQAPSTSYAIVGFVLNDYDKKAQKIGKERPKYQDKKLRQAMAYAINRKEWIDAFYYGYGKPLNGLIPSAHWSGAKEGDVKEYKYDVDKAKQLLDEGGYKDKDGDGFREDPQGKSFVVNLKHYAGSNPTFEPRTAALKGYWEKVGLKTKVEMEEFGKYSSDLEKSSKDMEVYFRTWQQGSDPDPSELYRSTALWNESRYNNPKADKILDEAVDTKVVGDDNDKRKEKYLEWQKIMAEDVPVIPIVELEDVTAVSSRVKNFEVSLKGSNPIYEWSVEDKK
ncbi:oligopeptide ABC transporter substrate-binding protein [Staphylococcus pseudintermedius]|uniref:oligopeptide ABC transporter substrate-binding protein n=1 Tax=Staphylococcus pseudintermedius TaxID=283734 RepID=UPI001021EF70|nr:oligopeptide ABC transporter substrate-binding protein [Staphylococcus pseudintermedius]EGQ1584417.1 ABC transporter substrate-binding protein [Staphylococcus pseudintermedius]EGQ1644518.1 ABC transporter substrate-binding protein [Staphylococcus pseudintermedius]EGQ1703891.1 ABC transporter substrate-binding protein [Staphylococcus pseudintermedius]EGQ2798126.1 ABC transporter substrate-binding protein [Staphylococcus pseudintermedius]EGQ2809937.1 ABC transporter substrate-binding protein 